MGMGLFGYYAWHSFQNQIKKLFKTWVLVFFAVCMLIGVIIGIGAATLDDAVTEDDSAYSESIEEETPEEEVWDLEIEPMALIELVAGGLILVCFVMVALGADKNGSSIFLPADVNLLFASPMQPQSVLMFRLAAQLGSILLLGVYFLFQLPNFLNMGLSVWGALAAMVAYGLVFAVSKLIQVLLYTVCSTHIHLKKHLRTGIFAFVGALAAVYYLYWKQSGLSHLAAADALFNSPISRFIPFWGWIKGFLLFAIEGKELPMLLCLLATVAGGAVLAYIIWHIKADFYEDAMAKSQETAELLERAQSEKAGATVVKRKKDRSERLRRDAMNHGSGASVFFFKTLYNRFRFAHLRIFTKTSETYLLAALAVAALCRFVFHAGGTLPVALTLGVLSFYRAMGNSLAQDVQMHYFLLVPESTAKKLWYSLLGSSLNCLLDLLPGMVAAALLLGENLFGLLAWMPLLLSVDFFSTTAGTFLGVSIPASVDKTIRRVVMVLFLYFGLLPDVVVMVVGIVAGQTALAAAVCAVVNIVIGLLFFALIPSFVTPGSGKKYQPSVPFAGDLRQAKKHFSRVGLGVFALVATGIMSQLAVVYGADAILPQWQENGWTMYPILILSQYVLAIPLMLLVMKKAPHTPIEKTKLKPANVAVAVFVGIFMMYAGNFVGVAITSLLDVLTGKLTTNPVQELVMGEQMLPTFVFVVVVGPIIEEFIFRKQLIDRMHTYGEKTAVFVSALLFGLFHGNLSQFFYAFALGLVFGYLYVRSGKLRYSIGLHMLINFMGGVIAPWFLSKLGAVENIDPSDVSALLSVLPWLLAFMGYAFLMFGSVIAGLILLIVQWKNIRFQQGPLELPREKRFVTVWCNAGMILTVLTCIVMIVLSLL